MARFRQRAGLDTSKRLEELNKKFLDADLRHLDNTKLTLSQGEHNYKRLIGQVSKRDTDAINQWIDVANHWEQQKQEGIKAAGDIATGLVKLGGSIAMQRKEAKEAERQERNAQDVKEGDAAFTPWAHYKDFTKQSPVTAKNLQEHIDKERGLPKKPFSESKLNKLRVEKERNESESKGKELIEWGNWTTHQTLSEATLETPETIISYINSTGAPSAVRESTDKGRILNWWVESKNAERAYIQNNPDEEIELFVEGKGYLRTKLKDLANHEELKTSPDLYYAWLEYFYTHKAGVHLATLYSKAEFQTKVQPRLDRAISNKKAIFGKAWSTSTAIDHKATIGDSITRRALDAAASGNKKDIEFVVNNLFPHALKGLQFYNKQLGKKSPNLEALNELKAIRKSIFLEAVSSDTIGSGEALLEAFQNMKIPRSLAPPISNKYVDKNGMVLASDAWPRDFGEAVIEEEYQKILSNKITYTEEADLNNFKSDLQNLRARITKLSPYDEKRNALIAGGIELLKEEYGDRHIAAMNAFFNDESLRAIDYSDSYSIAKTKIRLGTPLNPTDLHRMHPGALEALKEEYGWDGESDHHAQGFHIFEKVDLKTRITKDDFKLLEGSNNAIREGLSELGFTDQRDSVQYGRIIDYVNEHEIPKAIRQVINKKGYKEIHLKEPEIWEAILREANQKVVTKIESHRAGIDPDTGKRIKRPMYWVDPVGKYIYFEENLGAIPGVLKTHRTLGAEQYADVNLLAQAYKSKRQPNQRNPISNTLEHKSLKPRYFNIEPDGTIHDFWFSLHRKLGNSSKYSPLELMQVHAEKNGYKVVDPIVTQGDGQQREWTELENEWKIKLGVGGLEEVRSTRDNNTANERTKEQLPNRPLTTNAVVNTVTQTQSIDNPGDLGKKYETEYLPKAVEFVKKNKLKARASAAVVFIYAIGQEPQLNTDGTLIVPELVKYMLQLQKGGGILNYPSFPNKGGLA